MGKRGPIPTKKALKVLSGKLPITKNNGSGELSKTNFEPPDIPKDLSAEEKKIWNITVEILKPLRILEKIDGGILAAYCCSYVRWRQAEAEIRKMARTKKLFGLVTRGANNNIVANPLTAISRNERAAMLACAVQLGMTPAARMRVQVMEKEPRDNPFEKLKEKKNVDMGSTS